MTFTWIAFGMSDMVEVQTGAWWRSWWLLVWKGSCVLAMLTMLRVAHRARTRPRGE